MSANCLEKHRQNDLGRGYLSLFFLKKTLIHIIKPINDLDKNRGENIIF